MIIFFFQAEDGIRDLVRSRGLGDVYKRQQSDDLVSLMGLGAGVGLSYQTGNLIISGGPSFVYLSLIHI